MKRMAKLVILKLTSSLGSVEGMQLMSYLPENCQNLNGWKIQSWTLQSFGHYRVLSVSWEHCCHWIATTTPEVQIHDLGVLLVSTVGGGHCWKNLCPVLAGTPIVTLPDPRWFCYSNSWPYKHPFRLLQCTLHGLPLKTTWKMELVHILVASVLTSSCCWEYYTCFMTAIGTGTDIAKQCGCKIQHNMIALHSSGNPSSPSYCCRPKMHCLLSGKWQKS